MKRKRIRQTYLTLIIILTGIMLHYSLARGAPGTWKTAGALSAASPDAKVDEPATDLIYSESNYRNAFAPGRVIVGLKEGTDAYTYTYTYAYSDVFSQIGVISSRELARARKPWTNQAVNTGHRILLLFLKNTTDQGVLDAIQTLKADSNVAYAEPDYVVQAISTVPNDPSFNLLYGVHNTGQSGGTSDADIDAPEAWDRQTGSMNVLVGVIDTGIDYTHPDLVDNIWTNPGEIPGNGIDDDGNGYIDDIHGWDFCNDDSDPWDDNYHGHGTHCAGTIAARGNNGLGVVGVCWQARLVALKFLAFDGYGLTSDAIEAVSYATAMGIPITSNSWGGGSYSQALKDAIDAAGTFGYLFVAAAGNYNNDNDISPHYPSSYTSENIIAVAATDHNDQRWYLSNYGPTSVDLGAPGVNIYSCQPGGGYRYLSGTSMATPHVSGAAALVLSYNPGVSGAEIKAVLLDCADVIPSLSGMVLSNGRLNVNEALDCVLHHFQNEVIPAGTYQYYHIIADPGVSIAAGTGVTLLAEDSIIVRNNFLIGENAVVTFRATSILAEQGIVIKSGAVVIFEAADSITAGPNFIIEDGAQVFFRAGNSITLLPDFTANTGAIFEATYL